MRDSIEAGRFEVAQRVRAMTTIELQVIRAKVNDAALSRALAAYDAEVNAGRLPDPRSVAEQAFSATEAQLTALLK